MCLAARASNEAVVGLLIQHGAVLNTYDTHGTTPLHMAIICRNAAIVRQLLAAKADPNLCTRAASALQYAVESGNVLIVDLLIAAGVSVDRPARGKLPLLIAVEHNYSIVIHQLLRRGAMQHCTREEVVKLQLLAAIKGQRSIAKMLLKASTSVPIGPVASFYVDYYDVSLLQKVLNMIVRGGDSLDIMVTSNKTALMYAVHIGEEDAVERLLTSGASVKTTNDRGLNALHFADVADGRIVRLLLKAGADPYIEDHYSNKALDSGNSWGKIDYLDPDAPLTDYT